MPGEIGPENLTKLGENPGLAPNDFTTGPDLSILVHWKKSTIIIRAQVNLLVVEVILLSAFCWLHLWA